jgi:hypothetical protein
MEEVWMADCLVAERSTEESKPACYLSRFIIACSWSCQLMMSLITLTRASSYSKFTRDQPHYTQTKHHKRERKKNTHTKESQRKAKENSNTRLVSKELIIQHLSFRCFHFGSNTPELHMYTYLATSHTSKLNFLLFFVKHRRDEMKFKFKS